MTETANGAAKPLTPLEHSMVRLGPCAVNTGCRRDCVKFELAGTEDGFATCTCRHTRWAHEPLPWHEPEPGFTGRTCERLLLDAEGCGDPCGLAIDHPVHRRRP